MDDRFKFQVWDKKNKKWATDELDDLAREFGGNELCEFDMEDVAISQNGTLYLVDECGRYAYLPMERFAVVFCLGPKDRNGRPIYEGDLLTSQTIYLKEDRDIVQRPCVVAWNDKYAMYVLEKDGHVSVLCDILRGWNPSVFEVVGNKFENPDLIARVDDNQQASHG